MTFRVSLLIDADGKAATVQITRVGEAMQKTTASTKKLGQISTVAEAETRQLASSQKVAAQTALELDRSHRIAAGSVGNLTAQFNDIGQMMLAGQNPLTLAVQQGTQISQVLGPMGARKAVTALGSALMGMLNPVSLITVGSIAAGAAMIQWLTSAGDAALTTEDALTSMEESVDAYSEALRRARAPTEELRALYGQMTEEARQDLQLLADIARRDMQRAAAAVAASITDGIDTANPEFGDQQALAEKFDLSLLGRGRQERQALVNEVLASFQQLDVAGTGSLDRHITAFERAIVSYKAAAEAQSGVSAEEDAVLGQLGQQLSLLRQARTEETSGFELSLAAIREQIAGQLEIVQAHGERVIASAAARLEDEATAQSMLAATAEQSNMQALIAQFGAESARVADAQAAAARAVYEATVDALDVTAARKKELMVSYDVERMMASLNIAGPIDAAAGSAATLAGNMSAALSFAQQIAMVQAATPEAPAALGFGLGAAPNGGTGTTLGFGNNRGSTFNAPPTNFGGAGAGAGGGGGGGAAREERDAVAELIKRLQEEADIRAELDPVQQQMLRYREDLAGATAEQRAEVEALIAAEQREADAAQATQDRWQYLRQTAYDALLIMAKGGDDASDALRNLGASLAEAAFQAAIMGEGPLGSLFGGTSIFGLIGGAVGLGGGRGGKGIQEGGLKTLAAGGYITGPGDGTSDSILMYGSSGEMMMNARAVRKNRHLLEAMNANAPVLGYARGGIIGKASSPGGYGVVGGQPVIASFKIDVTGARGNAEIMDMVRSGVEQGMAHYDRAILPASVTRISADARRIG